MINYVLGAPGSGKSSIVPLLRELLPGRVVLDWDAFMVPAGELAGAPIPQTPQTWEPYGRLVRAVGEAIHPADMVLLGVCTPDELTDWPAGPWMLLDCSDPVRRQRLDVREDPDETEDALVDARNYRALGLPTIDTTNLAPGEVARAVASMITGDVT
jgi:hypothetical protein